MEHRLFLTHIPVLLEHGVVQILFQVLPYVAHKLLSDLGIKSAISTGSSGSLDGLFMVSGAVA